MRTLILGFDAFDPAVFERLSGRGKLPNLARYAEAGGYAPFQVANPPQSEVSWTSIATGLNPGGHGIFDFVHRDPASYALTVSLLPTRKGLAGTGFVPPFQATTLFDHAARQGFPATALWWPATFPARPESPVRTIPGLGTPDIQGRLGVGMLFSTDARLGDGEFKTAIETLSRSGKGRFVGTVRGPVRKSRKGISTSTLDLQLDLAGDDSARLHIGKQSIDLKEGEWSPVIELCFRVGLLFTVRALTRAILAQSRPDVRLYLLPLQIHPLHSAWRYATPGSFVKDTWRACGPFLTLGWQQDTTALEEGCIDDEQFLQLCDWIMRVREAILRHHLDRFDEGVLASVFDSLDRVQHMFWRDQPAVIEAWYIKLDDLLGRIENYLSNDRRQAARILVVSDHGFSAFDHRVHLNRWLVDRGYLVVPDDQEKGSLRATDWSRTRAYALGLNSLYLNLEGREGQGCVARAEYDALVEDLRRDLLTWRGPDGRSVVQAVERQSEAFDGPLAQHGPDLVVGYSPGYRASADTGLGKWGATILEANNDHWGADHCVAAGAVPGVLFCNQGLTALPNPSYRDFPPLAVGMVPEAGKAGPPPGSLPGDDQETDEEIIEERLRGLGYL